MGGMTKAVESGWAKLRIEAVRRREKQARIDRGEDVIVGVNKYRLDAGGPDRDPRDRQHRGARSADRAPGAGARDARRRAPCAAALAALTEAARAGKGNLLDARDRGRARARDRRRDLRRAREGLGPLPRARPQSVSGVYGAAFADDGDVGRSCKAEIDAFAAEEGRRPRLHGRQARPGRPRPRRQGRSRPRSPTSASTSTSARCSRRRRRRRGRRSRTTCTWSASRRSRPATRRWCRSSSRRCARRARDDIVVVVGGVIPRAGLRVPGRGGRGRHLRPGHARSPTCARRRAGEDPRCAHGAPSRRERAGDAATREPPADARSASAWSPACAPATGARSPRRSRWSSRRARDHQRAAQRRAGGAAAAHRARRCASASAARRASGKSTFIEALGLHLIGAGHRVAVLAVDPSSTRHRRLDPRRQDAHGGALARRRSAFIRPSPAGGALGGVARAHARGDAGLRGGRLRRRHRRDRRRRPVARPPSPA